jgi:hypothetical protein
MGFLLEIILEFFIEFVLQIAAEILVELPFQRLARTSLTGKTLNTLLAFVLYFGLGVLMGWLSTLIFPNSFIRSSSLHGISLVITPVLAGLTMWGIGWLRQRQGMKVIRLDTFGYGFLFALGMALIRFFFTR